MITLNPGTEEWECHQLLLGGDLDGEEMSTLRRRVEDCLRKQPATMLKVAAMLAADERIRIDDLI